MPTALILCDGEACRHARTYDMSGSNASVRVEQAACMGPCQQAPLAEVRIGEESRLFRQLNDQCDAQAVYDYAVRAADAGSFFVETGTAQPHLFDPVHDPDPVSLPLAPFAYLVGRFRGVGKTLDGAGGDFTKEVHGTWIAKGKFIGLNMTATYPLPSGEHDIHEAFVVLGHGNGAFNARAFTDGGTEHPFELEADGDRLIFPDRLPAHVRKQADRARKIIEPTRAGYRETLEIGDEHGFRPHYTTEFERVS